MISLIALEALLILFAAPLPVSVRLHVSDERSYAAASVSLFGARLVTARAEIAKDRVRMRINGKNAEEFHTKNRASAGTELCVRRKRSDGRNW